MNRFSFLALAVLALPGSLAAQLSEGVLQRMGVPTAPTAPVVPTKLASLDAPADSSTLPPAPAVSAKSADDQTFAPTWETQKQARTYLLSIPPPRGQIVDRNGNPLAQTRVSYNLAIAFPTPLRMVDREVSVFVGQQLATAQSILGRSVTTSPEQAIKHYKNRGVLPYVIAQDLPPSEIEAIRRENPSNLVLQATYQRFYPNAALAGHVIGYAGRSGRTPDKPLQNGDPLWSGAEGREGLEQTFDDQLQGKPGQLNISFDASGKKVAEQVSIPPQPGYNVVTTLDENIQRICEQALAKGAKRGAMVIIDPNTGDILALASWPSLNPNSFIPNISAAEYKVLQDDKDIPLLPRAFRSAYPPGSTFKVFVGLAGMNSGKIEPGDEFGCPAALEIGNLTFRNWKKTDSGSLNFADALTQSCNTWFYQAGMKMGGKLITDYATRLGLGMRTGIPLASEADGRIPTDDYMLKVYKRRMLNGDVANLSIGQGDTLITPLQMAQAMGAVGNGGTLNATRLVTQVQSLDGQIVTAYNLRARGQIDIEAPVIKAIRRGMVQVVESRSGTAGKAQVDHVHVAGKTGTAQWGPKNNERTAAWFAGFAPADKPRYAFSVLYEGEANDNDIHGGSSAAPMIGKVLRELFRDEPKEKKKAKNKDEDEDSDTPPKSKPEEGEGGDEETAPARVAVPAPTPPPSTPRRLLFPIRQGSH